MNTAQLTFDSAFPDAGVEGTTAFDSERGGSSGAPGSGSCLTFLGVVGLGSAICSLQR